MAGDRLLAPCFGALDPTAQPGPCTSVCLYHVCHQPYPSPTCCRQWAPGGCSCSSAGQPCPTGPAGGQPAAGRLAPAARPAGAGWMDPLKGVNNDPPFVGTPHPTYPHPLLTQPTHFPERTAARITTHRPRTGQLLPSRAEVHLARTQQPMACLCRLQWRRPQHMCCPVCIQRTPLAQSDPGPMSPASHPTCATLDPHCCDSSP